jgi:hypothetical protein
MNEYLNEELQLPSQRLSELLQLSLQTIQLSLPAFRFTGRFINEDATPEDCHLEIFARDDHGNLVSDWNLGIEIYTVGVQLSLVIERLQKNEYPILWHGQHSVWMDAETGSRVDCPIEGESLEQMANRLLNKLNTAVGHGDST